MEKPDAPSLAVMDPESLGRLLAAARLGEDHPVLAFDADAVRTLAANIRASQTTDRQVRHLFASAVVHTAGVDADDLAARYEMRRSYLKVGSMWEGAIRTANGAVVISCGHSHRNRDQTTRSSGDSAQYCARLLMRALAETLAAGAAAAGSDPLPPEAVRDFSKTQETPEAMRTEEEVGEIPDWMFEG